MRLTLRCSRRSRGALRAFLGMGAAVATGTLAGQVRASDPSAAAPASKSAVAAAPAKPLTIGEFLAPPELAYLQVSPKGDRIAYAVTDDGVDYLMVQDLATSKRKALIKTRKANAREEKVKERQHIIYVRWKTNDRLVVTVSTPTEIDFGSASELLETPVHYVVDANGATPARGINQKTSGKRARVEISFIEDPLRNDPDHILMSFEPALGEIQIERVDIRDGSRVVLERPERDVIGYDVDRKGNVVTRYIEHFDGSITVQGRPVGETRWTKLFDITKKTVKAASEWQIVGYGDKDVIYVTARTHGAKQGDTQEVRTFDLKTATVGPVVWSNPTYDVENVVVAEESGELLAGCYWADVYQCDFKNPDMQANLKGLSAFFQHARSMTIVSQSDDDKTWILHVTGPDEPSSYYLYDFKEHHIEALGDQFSKLAGERLGHMRRFDFEAADKTPLSAYVTEPPGAGPGPLPLVVMPHGGPEARDYLAYDEWAQFLAARGYMVLQPNFRGSGGFGRKFAEAGYGEWGGRMHDDVTQAVKALIATGRVDPNHICIVGASYGGYEALWAAHAEPDLYKCAVSVDGLSDLRADMNWERRNGESSLVYKYWARSIGDPKTDADRIVARSPVTYAKTWTTPLLLIHGDKDDVVDVAQSRIMNRALLAEHKTVRYVEINKMGHGPETDEETTQVFTEIDTFLAQYLKPAAAPAPRKAADASKP